MKIILLLTVTVLLFQNCSINSEGGMGGFTDSGSEGPPTVTPDSLELRPPAGATSLTLNGACDPKKFTDHRFEFVFRLSPESSGTIHEPTGLVCANKRFSITVALSDLGAREYDNGILGVRIVGITDTKQVIGEEAHVRVDWTLPPNCPKSTPADVPALNDITFYGTLGVTEDDYNAVDNTLRSWTQVGTLDRITFSPNQLCLESNALLRWPDTELFSAGEWINGNLIMIVHHNGQWRGWPGTWLRSTTSALSNNICLNISGSSILTPGLTALSGWSPCPRERVCMMLSSIVRKGIRYPESNPLTERTNIVCTNWGG